MLVKMRGSNGETVTFGDKTVRMVSQVSHTCRYHIHTGYMLRNRTTIHSAGLGLYMLMQCTLPPHQHTHSTNILPPTPLTHTPTHTPTHTHTPLQPGECPVVLEVSTLRGDVSSAVLPIQGVLPETNNKPESYSAGSLCFW